MEDDRDLKGAGKTKKTKGKSRLVPDRCIACGRCEPVCPVDTIRYDAKGEPVIDLEKCIGCKRCVKVCPVQALEMFYPEGEKATETEAALQEELEPKGVFRPGDWNGVWVLVEHARGKANPVSWELLGKGRELALALDSELAAVLLGDSVEPLAADAFGYGADKIYYISHPALRDYRTEPYLEGFTYLANKYRPEVVLIGATALGRDLAGAIATELSTGLTADCTALSINSNTRLLEQTRPAFGGNVMATIVTEHARPQMASVRPKVLPIPPLVEGRTGQLISESIGLREEDAAARILETITISCETDADITASDIVVSGGRGMTDGTNFAMLQELARLLGGVVGASRSAVDAGWAGHERQVGQTGKTVRPKLYIACGISGAIQHLVGMQNAEHIIAINKDKNAPIFEVAHLGIVGDVFEVVPALIDKLKQRVAPPVCET